MAHPSPDAAIAGITLGVLLIYWELNRPGAILPGAIGLLTILFSIATLTQVSLQPAGIVLIATATLLLALGLRYNIPTILPIAATTALILGLYLLPHQPENRTHIATSLLCGLSLGTATSRLAAIAHRARRNKGLD